MSMERIALDEMPYDRDVYNTGTLQHATGWAVKIDGQWWNEYEGLGYTEDKTDLDYAR